MQDYIFLALRYREISPDIKNSNKEKSDKFGDIKIKSFFSLKNTF